MEWSFFDYLYREADGTSDVEIFYLSNITAQAGIFSGDSDARLRKKYQKIKKKKTEL